MSKPRYLEFDLDDHHYRVGRIDAITQLGISMKFGPILPALGRVRTYLQLNPDAGFTDLDPNLLKIVGEAMEQWPDTSREFVVEKMMRVVDRKEGEGWLPVWDEKRRTLAYDELGLRELIALMFRVFEFNMASFTNALGLNSSARAAG